MYKCDFLYAFREFIESVQNLSASLLDMPRTRVNRAIPYAWNPVSPPTSVYTHVRN